MAIGRGSVSSVKIRGIRSYLPGCSWRDRATSSARPTEVGAPKVGTPYFPPAAPSAISSPTVRALLHLHRSIVFWAGLLVVAFIIWAWVDSQQRRVSWQYASNPHHSLYIDSRESIVFVQSSRMIRAGSFSVSGRWGRFQSFPIRVDEPNWLRVPSTYRVYRPVTGPSPTPSEGVDRRVIIIPYCLMLFAAGLIWLPLSFWRARRICLRNAVVPSDPQ